MGKLFLVETGSRGIECADGDQMERIAAEGILSCAAYETSPGNGGPPVLCIERNQGWSTGEEAEIRALLLYQGGGLAQ